MIFVVTVLAIVILISGFRPDYVGYSVLGKEAGEALKSVYMVDMKGGR